MMFSSLALLPLFMASVIATPAATSPAAAASLLTPQGLFAAANVHEVPKGGKVQHVGSEIHLLDATGTVIHVATNDYTPIKTLATPNSTASVDNGWIAYAYWVNSGDPINSFEASTSVPPSPSVWSDQTLFYFNGIQTANADAILTTALQYGSSAAGGGEGWSVATWYTVGSQSYYTPVIDTVSGASFQGSITLSSVTNNDYTYVAGVTDADALEILSTEQLVWATVTFEVTNVADTLNFPSQPTIFSGVSISTTGGTPPVSWGTDSDGSEGVFAIVDIQGASNAEITIAY